jgi:aryl-alcohol dehydrogenase-like predicted oxidoreductase
MEYVSFRKSRRQAFRTCLADMFFSSEMDWELEIDEARPVVKRSLDLGINFYDTARVHSNRCREEIISELRHYRDALFLATKVYFPVGAQSTRS